MDDVTREYLDAINKIATPKPPPLSEEMIWADYMVALASNPEFAGTSTLEDSLNADSFLHEFKKRFRD